MTSLGSIKPYYDDGAVQLYLGRLEDVLPQLDIRADLIVADPPYAETSLAWDSWPVGWPARLAEHGSSMWCFGSMRMFLERRDEFDEWKLSQDVVWEKHNGSTALDDRFRRVHEHVTHWYRGKWETIHHVTPTTPDAVARTVRRRQQAQHWSKIGPSSFRSYENGPRLTRSVIFARSLHGQNPINPTQKPDGILEPLIRYGCPPGGLVLDPFAGSCSSLIAARNLGMRAVGIEMREEQCELAVRRLAQDCLPLEVP